ASKIPKCVFQLGDRPLSITIQRALGALSWWRTIKLLWSLLVHPTSISKKEVEDYKNSDFLEKMLLELSKEYPELGRVFIHERDKFLAYSLQVATRHYPSVERPLLVVGVVGLGHISGIVKHFGKVTAEEIRELLRVPEPSKSSIIIQKGFKYTAVVACVYFSFKMLPMSVKTGIFEMTQKILPSK
ncbi:traB domain-containing protein-like, partial [Ctenocephalides felis]